MRLSSSAAVVSHSCSTKRIAVRSETTASVQETGGSCDSSSDGAGTASVSDCGECISTTDAESSVRS